MAAAGGSAAGVAGKPVSDGLDKVVGLLKSAPRTGEVKAAELPLPPAVQFDPGSATASFAPRVEGLSTVAAGTTRQDLIAIAGRPASQIIMGEGGHVMEVYTYRYKGEWAGSVRLTDGAVTSVRTSAK